jgi:hypothetical protein
VGNNIGSNAVGFLFSGDALAGVGTAVEERGGEQEIEESGC